MHSTTDMITKPSIASVNNEYNANSVPGGGTLRIQVQHNQNDCKAPKPSVHADDALKLIKTRESTSFVPAIVQRGQFRPRQSLRLSCHERGRQRQLRAQTKYLVSHSTRAPTPRTGRRVAHPSSCPCDARLDALPLARASCERALNTKSLRRDQSRTLCTSTAETLDYS